MGRLCRSRASEGIDPNFSRVLASQESGGVQRRLEARLVWVEGERKRTQIGGEVGSGFRGNRRPELGMRG